MENKKLTQFLGTLYKKHGMSITYVNGYVDTKTNGLPVGVYKTVRGKYACDVKVDKKTTYLGSFDTPEEAFLVRKKAKKEDMVRLANKWKGIVDDVVIKKLMNFDYDESGNLKESNKE